ncbi:VOC family protein [Azospirillum brasilense]|uniref:VOC family protein n=1 Tax=Azospirillum brasilense TaxID=192 RepID=UPI0019094E54|nr:VOC family protein [Azospirillum brasilense]
MSIGVSDLSLSRTFYDAVFPALNMRALAFDGDAAVGYGQLRPWFWISIPLLQGNTNLAGNGTHFAFKAHSRDAVDNFYCLAMQYGGTDAGRPGFRPEYGVGYYAAFAYDNDGHKIEAVFRAG